MVNQIDRQRDLPGNVLLDLPDGGACKQVWPSIVLIIPTSRMASGRRWAVLWPPIALTIRTSRMASGHGRS
jgi:hypothetical protein